MKKIKCATLFIRGNEQLATNIDVITVQTEAPCIWTGSLQLWADLRRCNFRSDPSGRVTQKPFFTDHRKPSDTVCSLTDRRLTTERKVATGCCSNRLQEVEDNAAATSLPFIKKKLYTYYRWCFQYYTYYYYCCYYYSFSF